MSRALTWILVAGLAGALAGIAACGGGSSPTAPSPPGGQNPPPPAAAPTVTGVSPTTGAAAGGTTVTITGTNFAAGAAVTIGGTPATEISVASATSITARTPARPGGAGAADIVVTVGGRTGSLASGFTYVNTSAPSTSLNNPPVIGRIRVRGTRPGIPFNFADLGETINLTAEVRDEETAIEQLTFEWRAANGTIVGTGPAVQWRAPESGAREYTIELTVIERYTGTDANGAPAPMEHRVTASTFVNVHNSVLEIREMARQFLIDFSQQRPADVVLRNFTVSAGCPRGRAKELADVEQNQRENVIKEYVIGDPQISVEFAGVCRFAGELGDACAYVPVRWSSLYKNTEMRVAEGTDQVTAMYEGNRWWICDSHFIPKGTNGTVRSWFKQ